MAKNDSTRTLINGRQPVSILDVECIANITVEQSEAMGTFFRTIARLTDDKEIKALCEHGALQAAMQGNDIDVLRERVVEAGFAVKGV